MQIDGRDVLQPADLLADLFDDLRMTMADGDGDDAGEAVEVLLAGFVPEVLHLAFDDQQRVLVVGEQARREILLAQGEDFGLGRAGVGFRFVRAPSAGACGVGADCGDLANSPGLQGGTGVALRFQTAACAAPLPQSREINHSCVIAP